MADQTTPAVPPLPGSTPAPAPAPPVAPASAPATPTAPADPYAGKVPDAIKSPPGWASGDKAQRALTHKQVLGAIFGLPPEGLVWMFNMNTYNLCIPDPKGRRVCPDVAEVGIVFGKLHARAGEERYAWRDQPSGLVYGYLKPEEDES